MAEMVIALKQGELEQRAEMRRRMIESGVDLPSRQMWRWRQAIGFAVMAVGAWIAAQPMMHRDSSPPPNPLPCAKQIVIVCERGA